MTESFCNLNPPDETAQAFVDAVNRGDATAVDRLLTKHDPLRAEIDQLWFAFDAPAIVAAKDNESLLKVLLKHGANMDARSSWWAGSFGVLDGVSPEMAQFLIERGATLDIHTAAEQGKLDLVQEFLERDPELINARGGDGQTPLHVASTIEIVDHLIENGADVGLRCLDHSATAAQYAVSDPPKCRHLIDRGATPDIFMASALGDRELVELVIREDPDCLASRVGQCRHTRPVDPRSHLHIYFWKLLSASTPIEVAREFNHPKLVEEFYRRSPATVQFLTACWNGDRNQVALVLAEHPNVFDQLSDSERAEMARAAWEGRLESVRVMLEFGFDPHRAGADNSTPLDRAAFHGHREIVELLLAHDKEPPLEMKNAYGGTPLSCCAYGAVHSWKRNTDHLGTAKALIAAGAQVDPSWLPVELPEFDALFRKYI